MYTIPGYRGDTGGRCILYLDTGGIQEVGVYYTRIQGDTGGRSILLLRIRILHHTTSGYRGDTGGRFILYQDTEGIQEVGVYYTWIQGDTGGRCILYLDTGGIHEVEVYYMRIRGIQEVEVYFIRIQRGYRR